MSDVELVIGDLGKMADGIMVVAREADELVEVLGEAADDDVRRRIGAVGRAEERVDEAFDLAVTRVMDLEVLPVNPDYFLEVAKDMDRISDVIERTALLLEWKRKLGAEETELLQNASHQVRRITERVAKCILLLGSDATLVEEGCAVIAEREKAVDQIRDRYYRISSAEGYDIQTRLWLSEVIGNLDSAADSARDLSIALRSVSRRLERQRRLDVKKGTLA